MPYPQLAMFPPHPYPTYPISLPSLPTKTMRGVSSHPLENPDLTQGEDELV